MKNVIKGQREKYKREKMEVFKNGGRYWFVLCLGAPNLHVDFFQIQETASLFDISIFCGL